MTITARYSAVTNSLDLLKDGQSATWLTNYGASKACQDDGCVDVVAGDVAESPGTFAAADGTIYPSVVIGDVATQAGRWCPDTYPGGGSGGNEACVIVNIFGTSACVPSDLYPSANTSHCRMTSSWESITSSEEEYSKYRTGGLGKLMTMDKYEVWLCSLSAATALDSALPCMIPVGDAICFTYSEEHRIFVPWGLNSALNLF